MLSSSTHTTPTVSPRFRNDFQATSSSRASTTSTRSPSATPMALRAATASFVFGAAKPQSSMTVTMPSAARSERADRSASHTIFFGVRWR